MMSAVYPDMYTTAMPGRSVPIRLASSLPFIPGITRSVSSKWIPPPLPPLTSEEGRHDQASLGCLKVR